MVHVLNKINCARMKLIITALHNGGGCLNELQHNQSASMQITAGSVRRKQWTKTHAISFFAQKNAYMERSSNTKG